MKVFVLAAGFATRLYPLTLHQPKPLLDIGGKPVLTRLLDRVMKLEGLSEIVIIGNDRFNANYVEWAREFRSHVPVRVLNDGSTTDENKLGAIGDIAFALREVDLAGEDWLVIAGDNLLECDLAAYQKEFKRRGKPMILVRTVADRVAQKRYNEVVLDGEQNIASFKEKPADPVSNLVAIAVYFYPPAIRERFFEYLSSGGNPDAPGFFIEWLVKQTTVCATKFEGHWFDIGNFQTLEEARAAFAPPA